MTVLCDANLWVSAIHFQGVPLQSLRKSISQDRPLTCPELEDEIVRILTEKFRHIEERVRAQMRTMLADAIRVSVPGRLTGVCRDANDDFMLECAVLGNADVIVTGDKDLLALREYEGIRIVTPRQYLDME